MKIFFNRFNFKFIGNNFYQVQNFCTIKQNRKKICIIGSGPAGFYAAQYLLKQIPNCDVDIIERFPVPFGLVRFGVAPDHPEVKNVINTFNKVAENKSFRFLGNLCLGKDFNLKELQDRYHVVLLTYGAEKDRKLNIPNENSKNVISAREFVAWYNGLPGYKNLEINFDSNEATIIGQGNVGIDVARILLSSVDNLKSTDITDYALESLSTSKVKKVYLIGRRGPLQAAFTIKELREMLKLPYVTTKWREDDFESCTDDIISKLPRPRRRLTELMLNHLKLTSKQHKKQFFPIFMRSPILINDDSIKFVVNKVVNEKSIPTNNYEIIKTNLILRSIGYKSVNVDEQLSFDENNGYLNNINGRVLKKNSNEINPGIYVAGWLATGPLGVILNTMNGAFGVAKTICHDIEKNVINHTKLKSGLDIKNKRVVTWDKWKIINEAEIEAGKQKGKSREKIVEVDEMLKIAGL